VRRLLSSENHYYFIGGIQSDAQQGVETGLLEAAESEGFESSMRWYPETRKVRNMDRSRNSNREWYVEEDIGTYSLDVRTDRTISKKTIDILWKKGIKIRQYTY
jgi:hypothetical protein